MQTGLRFVSLLFIAMFTTRCAYAVRGLASSTRLIIIGGAVRPCASLFVPSFSSSSSAASSSSSSSSSSRSRLYSTSPTAAAPAAAAAGGGGGGDTVIARCTKKITDALSPTRLKVTAQHDDPNGSHISIECVSSMFEGKVSVMRQRLIYKAIWDEMSDGGSVHAVDRIIALTPQEDK